MDVRPLLPFLAFALLVTAAALGLGARRLGQPRRRTTRILAGGLAVLAIAGFVLSVLDVPASRAPVPGSLSIYYSDDTSGDLSLEAASAATGIVRWRYTPSSAPNLFSGLWPSFANGVFYLSADAAIRALRASDGKELWATAVEGEALDQQVAAIDHGVVYVTSGPLVVALRATDGRQLWQTSVAAITGSSTGQAQVADGVVYMAFSSGPSAISATTVYAINAGNGTIRWKYAMTANSASLLVADGIVYAEFPGSLVALDAGDGSVRWQHMLSPNKGPLAVAGGVVYMCDPEFGLIALDAMAGTLLWQRSDVGVGQTLIVASSVVYLLTSFIGTNPSGAVLAVNAQGGSDRWRTFLDNTAGYTSNLTLAGNMLYVGGDSTYALRITDGHLVWRYGSGAQFYQPAVSAGVVFVASTDYANTSHLFGLGSNDFVNALNARTGTLYWRTSGDVEAMPLLSS